ncbi:hypothetical protein I601_2757 [Nocardioides dokdonensis FR1436]|uniref:Uncharacterized protein n=1 Tax=Nocardioides dokdonensis FR1436 TaxID=1300347 RepID=A0A1A9GNK5_9ACTN|nr:hypothetical protein [Nocardioides dokdonensis]ANH39173.1 hypothetical protein I601_2757 [Nocardioides dokdonensis FR1436]
MAQEPAGDDASSGDHLTWSAVRARPTGERTERALPSDLMPGFSAALHAPEVPEPEPVAERAAVRRERRTTWGMRVAAGVFAAVALGGLVSTDIGAGLRDDVLARLPDLLVPGSSDPDEPAATPDEPGGRTDGGVVGRGAPVRAGTLLEPQVAPPTTPGGTAGTGTPPQPPVVGPPQPPSPPTPPTQGPPPVPPRGGTLSGVLDPAVAGVGGLLDSATGGATGPVTGVLVPATDGLTDLLDGIVEPVLGLLGGSATGQGR